MTTTETAFQRAYDNRDIDTFFRLFREFQKVYAVEAPLTEKQQARRYWELVEFLDEEKHQQNTQILPQRT